MYTPVQMGRLYQQIVDQIERRVLNGDLRHGDRLPTERELAEQFGVSRTVVREAMKALAQKGLIQVRPGRGTFVIDGTSQAMQHSLSLMMMIGQVGTIASLAEVREILEPEIAAKAALRATEANIAAMQAAVATMDATLDDSDAFIAADHAFHRALAEGTQNAIILNLIDSIVDLLQEQRKRISLVSGGPQRGQYHHKQILDAIARRDPDTAREAMSAHLRQIRNDSEIAATLKY
jgi:GntR family transcriptional repressor for pyruvate dehydrogenase complex